MAEVDFYWGIKGRWNFQQGHVLTSGKTWLWEGIQKMIRNGEMDGLFHGKSPSQLDDDWGYTPFF